jgi:hypothetical protein
MQPLTQPVSTRELEALCQALRSPGAAREVRRNSAMRQARSCYDHLAGVAGVQLLEAMLRLDWLRVQEGRRLQQYHLTPQGTQALVGRGMDISQAYKARRAFAYGCLDWTERRPHLAGALGAAMFEALGTVGVIRRLAGSRTVILPQPLAKWLDAMGGCSPCADLISSSSDSHQTMGSFGREEDRR